MSKSQIILIGLLITFFFAFGAPGDSTLNESFNSTIYPEWPEGWRRFSFETVTDNFWALSNQQPLTRPFCIKCLGTNLTRNQDWIITRMVYPTPGDTIFSFWYEAHNRSVYESLEVWISTTTPDTTGMTVRLDAFNFNNNSYLERIINLSDYLNTPIYVGIFYPPFNRLGARIDDVTGPHYPPLDVSPIAITIPGSNFLSPGSFTPAAIIKNYGSTSPASFSAVCTLYNEFGTPVYSDDQNISPFLPNTTTSVNFIQTPLLARGNYTLVVRTRLNGDMQAINDRTARQLAVAQGTENLYDDGITTQAVWADVSGEGYGVRFTPASYPKIIQGAEIMLSHDAYPPQPADNIFRIRLIDDDGLQGAPGTILWESNDIYGIRGEWNYIPINEITINSGDYYLFWIQGENYTQCAGIGADEVRNAPNRTQWRFSGGTYSENGLPPGDLMIRSVESELISDVGVIAITAPPAMVDSGQSVIPQAIVKNFGTIQLNNVPVRFWIDTWQSDTIITTLAPNESTIVNFSSWTAAQRGNFAVKCSTLLTGDMNPANDLQAGSLFVRVLDVQTISIIQPADTVNLGDTITPQTFIRNNGNTNVTFPVRFEITDGYLDDTIITLDPGIQTTVNFSLWTANLPGNFVTKCTTQLAGDMNNANDKQTGTVFVRLFDVQTITLLRPVGTVNQGDTVTPQAIIRNNGNTSVTFPVRFEISDGYSDNTTLTLNPGEQTVVNFTLWTANTPGNFATKCSTQLNGDMITANDVQTGSVFVGYIDVGVTSILAPPSVVDSGQTIAPQATVKNFGNTIINNIQVRFLIGSWQNDTVITSLAPNESTIVNFANWTASQRGTFVVKCSTRLTNDLNPTNDKQTSSVFIRVLDIQTLSIIQPTGNVNLGDSVNPQAAVINNGNTSVTFSTRFEISDGYFDNKTITLDAGVQTNIDFALWTANATGSFVTKCSTQLAGDMNPANDRQTGSVFVGFYDVGVTALMAPPATVDSGQTISPQARIKNFGNITANNIPVRFNIGTWQQDTIVTSLAPNESTIVFFAPWTAAPRGNLTVKCSTRFAGDINPTNDQQTGSVLVRVLDVQTIAILQPSGSFNPGDTLTPIVTIINNGNTSVTFPVRFEITDGYFDNTTITLNPGIPTSVNFALWTANTSGNFTTKCSTQLTSDMNTANDKQTGSVFVGFIDVGTSTILSPPATIDSGQTISPQAMIKNYGTTSVINVPVRFIIGSWQHDTIVTSLAPNESTTVTFAEWTANQRGSFVMKCSTRLAGDMNNTNDQQTGSVFVRVLDVQTISIIQPNGMFNQGDTITTQASIRNNGNTNVTFPVKFEITDGYFDEKTVTLDAGSQTTVNFALWTANIPGNFTTICTTQLNGDMIPVNDITTGSVFVQQLDVQTIAILGPTGSLNLGDTVTPQATVRNNGNTNVSFPVRFEISDGYSDEITVILNAGVQTTVNFALWTANNSGSFVTKCTTQLAGDMNNTNDKQTGAVFVGFNDVGTTIILAPPATVDSGQIITPQARVKNYGNTTVTNIPVRFTIGSWQNDITIPSLSPNESTTVNFANWTAAQRGNFVVKCSTRLTNDLNPTNDKQTSSVFVRVFDVQTISIIQPIGTFNQGDTVTPLALIRNNGNTSVTFPIRFEITDGYSDISIVTLNAGTQTTLNFALWTANTPGNFVTKCSTQLTSDMNTANDKQTGAVFVGFLDVGITIILAPPVTVDSGQTITPQARIKNFSNITVTNIPARFFIGSWQNDAVVASLAPNESTIVNFSSWTAAQRGSFAMKCSTLLIGDINASNDQQTGFVFVRVLDVQTISIIQPTGTVNQGDTITPQAFIRNNGNTNVTFPIRFEITDGYSDNATLTINAGTQAMVNFALWTANTPGSFVTKCTTQLAGDMNNTNDKQTGAVSVQFFDVQTIAILQPTDTLIQGDTITPKAIIRNNGNTSLTFPVRFEISDGYSDDTILTLDPGAQTTVNFTRWTANTLGSFETKCTTQLFDDMNTSNDRQVGSVFVGFLDVGTIAILSPPAIVDSGQMITPQAIVKNFGNIVANNIPVRFTVDIWQHDTVIISLVPNESIIVSFAPWTAQQRGDFALKCSTLLAGDNNRANDKQTGSVFVAVSDIGAIAILTPPAAIDSGQTANPQAIVKNFGNILLGYIPVRFSIGNWHHDTTIINLVPDESTIVTFANWTATQRGISTMKCSTRLMGDMQNSNDKFEDSILVRILDVGAKEIVAPIDSIIKDSIFTVKAIAKNYGNTQAEIAVYFTILKEPDTIYKKTTNITIEPLQELEISFGDTLLDSIGIYQTAFWTEFIGDMHPENNLVLDNFRVYIPIPPQERVWIRMADIPDMPSGRAPKRGSCMAGLEATGKIYYLKASNTQDFHIYFPELGTWANAETIPKGNKEDGDGKKPKRGSSMTGYEPTKSVYILRGNNTVGFWKYQADTLGDTIMPGWYKLTNIPLGAKKCKYGSGLTVVNKSGKDYIFTMKGSRTSEFYLYDIANDSWTQVSSPPVGPSGKRGYKKGSCLAYDENGFVYVLKSYYGDFFKYSVEGDSWYLLRRYDPKVFRNRYGKKKKVKEGAGIVYYNNSVYLLKGGNTYEFWKYDIAADDWFQMDEYWDIPSGSGKKVKGGGALIKFGEYFYASKGSKTFEFYRHILPTGAIAPIKTPPTFEGVMANILNKDEFRLMIAPNPVVNITTVRFNLPAPGPVSFKLYNICGVLLKSYVNPNPAKQGSLILDAKTLPAGVYVLRFNSKELSTTRKLVIEK